MADMNPTAAANTANTVTPQNEAEKKPMFWGSQEVFDNLEKFEKISNPTGNDFNFDFWDLQSPVVDEGQSTQEEQWLQQEDIAAEAPIQSSALSDFNFDDVVNSVAEWATPMVEESPEAWNNDNQEWENTPNTDVSVEQPTVEENPTSDIQNMNLEIPGGDKESNLGDVNQETAPIDLNIGDLPVSEGDNENNEEWQQQSETSVTEESNDFELDIPAQGPSFEEDKEDKSNQTEENIPSFDFDFPWAWTDIVNNEEKNWENIGFAPIDDERNDDNNEILDNQEEEEKQADPVLEVSLDDEDTKEAAETEENKEEESIEKEVDNQGTITEENNGNDEDEETEDESNEEEEDTDEDGEDEEYDDEDEEDKDNDNEKEDDDEENDEDEEFEDENNENENNKEDADGNEQQDDNNELENDDKYANEQDGDLWEETEEKDLEDWEDEIDEDEQEKDEEKMQNIEEDNESEDNKEEDEEDNTNEETIEEQSAEEKAALNMEEYDTENLSSLMKQYRELLNLAKTMIWLEQKINKDETITQTEIIGNNTEKNMIRYLVSIEWEENSSLIIMRIEKDYARDEESEHKLEFTSEDGDKNLIIKVDDFKLYEEILDLQDPVKQLQVWDKMKKFNFLFQWRLSELEEKMEEIKEMKEKMRAFRDIFRNF